MNTRILRPVIDFVNTFGDCSPLCTIEVSLASVSVGKGRCKGGMGVGMGNFHSFHSINHSIAGTFSEPFRIYYSVFDDK